MRSQRPDITSYGLVNRRDLRKHLKSLHTPLDLSPSEESSPLYFEYEGERWCAYEVLQVSPTDPPEKVERAYQEALKFVDEQSAPFVEKAYKSILISSRPSHFGASFHME